MGFIIVIAIIFGIWAVWYTEHSKNVEDNEKCMKGQEEYNAKISVIASHICGLPLGENSECKLYLTNDNIVIESTNSVFKLNKDKILDTSMKTSKEIQNSISGAVAGAMLLGPLGAFIGRK